MHDRSASGVERGQGASRGDGACGSRSTSSTAARTAARTRWKSAIVFAAGCSSPSLPPSTWSGRSRRSDQSPGARTSGCWTGSSCQDWGGLRVSAVDRRDVEALKADLRATPVQANRVLALLSKMFSLAMDWKMRPDNPAHAIKRYHEDRRENWLDSEQLQALATALDEYADQSAADAIRLLIVTGSRPQEVLTAEWSMFDLARAVWTKPSHHTKQKKTEHVPLSEAALMILRRMAASRKDGDVHLFPGKQDGRARTTLKNAWRQVCRTAGMAKMCQVMGRRGKMLVRWRPAVRVYDLRHSFASHLVSRGASLYLVGKLLGHVRPETTTRYAHAADSALRDITNTFPDVLGDRKKQPTSEERETPTSARALLAGD